MARFIIDECVDKNQDWKICDLREPTAPNLPYNQVSINRTNKKGEVFPGFDSIRKGGEVEGEPWQSPAGKWYLFAPKIETPRGGANRGSGAIKEMVKVKQEGIAKAQESKAEGIMTSSTMRDAVLIALRESEGAPFDVGVFKGRINFWREWLVANWEIVEK